VFYFSSHSLTKVIYLTISNTSVMEQLELPMDNVPANVGVANRMFDMVHDYMSSGVANSCQKSPGKPFLTATSNKVMLGSWTRMSSNCMVTDARDMIRGEGMNLDEILYAGERSDNPRDPEEIRIALSYFYYALGVTDMVAEVDDDGVHLLPPLVLDLQPCVHRRQGTTEDDFKEELGNVDIEPILELAYLTIEYLLAHYKFLFVDGFSVLDVILRYIGDDASSWTVTILDDDMISMFNDTFNYIREAGQHDCVVVLLIQNTVTNNISILYATYQMASTIGGVSTM